MTGVGEAGTVTVRSGPSFDRLYQAEYRALLALGWTLTGSREAAEELVQEAFLDAYRRWEVVGSLERPGAWVRRAVMNRSVDVHRRRRTAEAGLRRLHAERTPAPPDPDGIDATFWSAVRSLPERQAQCVALHYLEDRSVDEIAEILECAPATVKVHLFRGRQTLADRLGRTTNERWEEGR